MTTEDDGAMPFTEKDADEFARMLTQGEFGVMEYDERMRLEHHAHAEDAGSGVQTAVAVEATLIAKMRGGDGDGLDAETFLRLTVRETRRAAAFALLSAFSVDLPPCDCCDDDGSQISFDDIDTITAREVVARIVSWLNPAATNDEMVKCMRDHLPDHLIVRDLP